MSIARLWQDIVTLLNLAWPVMVSRAGILTLTITDTVMVGRYASEHLAYLGVGLVPHNIFILILLGLIMGTPVLVSNRFGAGELKKTGEVWWIALPWALSIGCIGFVVCAFGEQWLLLAGQEREVAARGGVVSLIAGLSLPFAAIHMATGFFLEGTRNPRPGMIIIIVANIVNIFANYVLVYGLYGVPELGAIGSVWATLIVRIMQVSAILFYVWYVLDREKYGINQIPGQFWLRGRDLRRIGYAAGVSMGIENTAFNALVLFAGLISTIVVAAHVVMITVFALFFMIGLGFGVATSVSVGNAYGAGDMVGVRRWAWLGLSLQSIIMLVFGFVMYSFALPTAAFYTGDDAVRLLAASMIAYAAVALIFDTGQSLMSMSLRARGDIWFPSFVHVIAYGLVMMPLTYVAMFVFDRGAMGLVDGVVFSTFLPFMLVTLRFHYLDRKQKLLMADAA